jgi:flagellar basal-body rod protein FlgG
MNLGLFRSAAGMSNGQRQVERVSLNLANVSTIGFKRTLGAVMQADPSRKGAEGRLVTTSAIDFSQGELDRTGRELDLALSGEGFFAVEGPEGELLTRDGTFQLSERGDLLDSHGFPVAWDTRSGVINASGGPVTVDKEGSVRQDEIEVGRLRIVSYEDLQQLQLGPAGTFVAPPNLEEVAHSAIVHQGALELSNANGLDGVIEMISAQRAFDASARVISMIDQSFKRLTRTA